jgi:shikimate kinase
MGRTVNQAPVRHPAPAAPRIAVRGGRPAIIELVGPAGAGKTALLRTIRARHPDIRAGIHIDRLRFAPVLARHTLALVPMSLQQLSRWPLSWWPSLVHVLRLRTFPSVLDHVANAGCRAILLDEGPVFSLARLSVFQDAHRGGGLLMDEWHRALGACAGWLDAVVWLDAPDATLIQRIRERSKAHQVKERPDDDVSRFLDRYREAFRAVLGAVRASGQISVIEVDTSRSTVEQAATALLDALPPAATPSGSGARNP